MDEERLLAASPQLFATVRLKTLEGFWDWENRPYLEQPYNDRAKDIVVEKSTQDGLTTLALARAIHGLKYRFRLGSGFFMPSFAEVGDLAKTKLARMTSAAPDLKPVDADRRDVENTRIKRIGSSFLYLRGAHTEAGVRSISVDQVIIDEVNEIDPHIRKMTFDRMGASPYQESIELSRPKLPGVGIDKRFNESDMQWWLVKCDGCRERVCLEKTFPKCVEKNRIVCPACGKPLDVRKGEWVAEHPDRPVSGYHFSQLINPMTDLVRLMEDWESGDHRDIFHNSRLGLPFLDAKLTTPAETILTQCGPPPVFPLNMEGHPIVSASMGVDVGKKIHVVLRWPEHKKVKNEKGQLEWVSTGKRVRLPLEFDHWEQVYPLIDKYGVYRCVVDLLPEMRNAQKFAEKFPGRVYICSYVDTHKMVPKFTEEDYRVIANRTLSLDKSRDQLMDEPGTLPPRGERKSVVRTFAEHCNNSVKVIKRDKHGSEWQEWIEKGADHFRHADNYASIAGDVQPPRVRRLV